MDSNNIPQPIQRRDFYKQDVSAKPLSENDVTLSERTGKIRGRETFTNSTLNESFRAVDIIPINDKFHFSAKTKRIGGNTSQVVIGQKEFFLAMGGRMPDPKMPIEFTPDGKGGFTIQQESYRKTSVFGRLVESVSRINDNRTAEFAKTWSDLQRQHGHLLHETPNISKGNAISDTSKAKGTSLDDIIQTLRAPLTPTPLSNVEETQFKGRVEQFVEWGIKNGHLSENVGKDAYVDMTFGNVAGDRNKITPINEKSAQELANALGAYDKAGGSFPPTDQRALAEGLWGGLNLAQQQQTQQPQRPEAQKPGVTLGNTPASSQTQQPQQTQPPQQTPRGIVNGHVDGESRATKLQQIEAEQLKKSITELEQTNRTLGPGRAGSVRFYNPDHTMDLFVLDNKNPETAKRLRSYQHEVSSDSKGAASKVSYSQIDPKSNEKISMFEQTSNGNIAITAKPDSEHYDKAITDGLFLADASNTKNTGLIIGPPLEFQKKAIKIAAENGINVETRNLPTPLQKEYQNRIDQFRKDNTVTYDGTTKAKAFSKPVRTEGRGG